MISPTQLKRKEFSKSLKGYSQAEVDEYLSALLGKYAEAYAEYSELEKKYKNALLRLEEAKNDESAFSAIVLDAHKMADAIVKDANDKAKSITDAVSESCDQILATYATNVTAERDKLAKLEKMSMDFKESLYAAYREHIEAIDKVLPDEREAESISDAGDEELVDSAVDLARRKIGDGAAAGEETVLAGVKSEPGDDK